MKDEESYLNISYGCDWFVVGVKFIEVRSKIIGDEDSGANNNMLSIIAEQAALPVQLFLASIHIHDVL